jgi:hypothetical protein
MSGTFLLGHLYILYIQYTLKTVGTPAWTAQVSNNVTFWREQLCPWPWHVRTGRVEKTCRPCQKHVPMTVQCRCFNTTAFQQNIFVTGLLWSLVWPSTTTAARVIAILVSKYLCQAILIYKGGALCGVLILSRSEIVQQFCESRVLLELRTVRWLSHEIYINPLNDAH